MNRIISINIQGLVFQIEEDAFQYLDAYLRKLRTHFKGQDGVDEILSDIESRIAEMLSRDPGIQGAVNLDRVKYIVSQMGDPAEIDQEDGEDSYEYTSAKSGKRLLYRDGENKIMGGVCTGLGSYFDIDPIWLRVGFLFAFFTFGTGLILYLILWAIIPEAKTPSERLEMKGENVTIDNIEKTVREEFNRFRKDFDGGKVANTARSAAQGATRVVGGAIGVGVKIFLRVLGLVLVAGILFFLVFMGFAYFGFLVDFWRTPFFPFFDQLFESEGIALLYSFALGGLFVLPLIGLLFVGLRLLLGISDSNRWIGKTIGALWVVSLIGVIAMVFTLSDSWRDHAILTQEQSIPKQDTLFIQSTNTAVYGEKKFIIEFGHRKGIRGIYAKENGVLKRPVKLNILVSNLSETTLKEERHSNGKTYEQAAELASRVKNELSVTGNTLLFNPYYEVSETDVWKNQSLEYSLYVPIGTVVVFGNNTSTFLSHVNTKGYLHKSRLEGKAFIMTREGLKVNQNKISNTHEGISYQYDNFSEINVSGVPEVVLFQSANYQIYTEKGANYTPEFSERGDELRIFMDPLEVGRASGILHIGMPYLKKIEVNGGTTVSVQFKGQHSFRAELNGAATLNGEIKADDFILEANGLNTCRLSGSCETATLELNGGGDFQLEDLVAEELRLEANGGTKVAVKALQKLVVEANGASTITYYGNPQNKRFERHGGSRIKAATP